MHSSPALTLWSKHHPHHHLGNSLLWVHNKPPHPHQEPEDGCTGRVRCNLHLSDSAVHQVSDSTVTTKVSPFFFPLHLPIFSPPLQCTASLFLFPHVHLTVPPIIFPCTCFTVRRCQGTMKAHFSLVLCFWHLPCVVFWGNPLSASGVLYANLYLWCATFNIHAHDVLYLYFRPAVFVFVMCRICRVLALCWNNFLLLLRPASASGQACRATSC